MARLLSGSFPLQSLRFLLAYRTLLPKLISTGSKKIWLIRNLETHQVGQLNLFVRLSDKFRDLTRQYGRNSNSFRWRQEKILTRSTLLTWWRWARQARIETLLSTLIKFYPVLVKTQWSIIMWEDLTQPMTKCGKTLCTTITRSNRKGRLITLGTTSLIKKNWSKFMRTIQFKAKDKVARLFSHCSNKWLRTRYNLSYFVKDLWESLKTLTLLMLTDCSTNTQSAKLVARKLPTFW